MANHLSAKKRNRQRIQRTARNRSVRSSMRTMIKKARAALVHGNLNEAKELSRLVEIRVDHAASKGAIHARTAARLKGRLYRRVHKATAAS